jgi:hypothetical protein
MVVWANTMPRSAILFSSLKRPHSLHPSEQPTVDGIAGFGGF